SEDASKLKPYIGCYVALDAENELLKPAIYSDNRKLHAKMGMNHPQLTAMLCPIRHLAAYHENPQKVQEQLQNGQVKMHAAVWPTFTYEGNLPGQDFDPLNMQDGLFKGY
ncbi:uncharacterized protein BJ212DRAFT_1220924, partial [Suillus subaureus]